MEVVRTVNVIFGFQCNGSWDVSRGFSHNEVNSLVPFMFGQLSTDPPSRDASTAVPPAEEVMKCARLEFKEFGSEIRAGRSVLPHSSLSALSSTSASHASTAPPSRVGAKTHSKPSKISLRGWTSLGEMSSCLDQNDQKTKTTTVQKTAVRNIFCSQGKK